MCEEELRNEIKRLENELETYKSANILLKITLDKVREMTENSVQIDKYVIRDEKSPKITVFDNELQVTICSFNTLIAEWNRALALIVLEELNTGKYEVVDENE